MLEQQADVQRQLELRQLAQLADARWNNQQSYLQAPPSEPTVHDSDSDGSAAANFRDGNDASPSEAARESSMAWEKPRFARDQWQGGGEKWQPQPWSPAKGGSDAAKSSPVG